MTIFKYKQIITVPLLKSFLLIWAVSCITSCTTNIPLSSSVNPTGIAPVFIPDNYSQDAPLNFVRTIQMKVPLTSEADINTTDPYQCLVNTLYTDGLGRPLQQVEHLASPNHNTDLVTIHHYDNLGRNAYTFLPYAKEENNINNAGKFKVNPFTEQREFYKNTMEYSQENYFYSQTIFEPSPLNRSIQTLPQGNAWVGNNTGTTFNQYPLPATTQVRSFYIENVVAAMPITTTTYLPGTLWVTITTDEDGNFTEQYTDKNQRIVLQNTGKNNTNTKLATYYVYDDFGKLRTIISPKAVKFLAQNNWKITQEISNNLCFNFMYDGKGRILWKNEPGVKTTLYVYNTADEPILIQNSEQRKKNEWTFYKYDGLGRILQTGIYTTTQASTTLQAIADGKTTANEPFFTYLIDKNTFDNNNNPNTFTNAIIYLTYYYDDYTFTTRTYDESFKTKMPQEIDTKLNLAARGRLTGYTAAINTDTNTPTTLTTINFYNTQGLLLQTQQQNHKNGWDITTNTYDFTGKIIATFSQINNPSASDNNKIETLETFTYDHYGRITNVYHSINGRKPIALENNTYDAMGRLKQKSFTNSEAPAEVYKYNIRGWLTSINKDFCDNPALANTFFGMEISYNYGYLFNYLNGNIAGIKWRNAGKPQELRSYGYLYDHASRLSEAYFLMKNGAINDPDPWNNDKKDFSTSNITYDENGNILTMKQKGNNLAGEKIILDHLSYSYYPNSNFLQAITESDSSQSKDPYIFDGLADFRDVPGTTDYTYDNIGNLLSDNNKQLAFNYNRFLNKIQNIEKNGGLQTAFLYNALGEKIQKKIANKNNLINTTDYIQNAVFNNNQLLFINHRQGRIRYTQNSAAPFVYDFFLKDHLASTRAVIHYAEASTPTISTDTTKDTAHYNNKITYIATSEPYIADKENKLFDNIETTRAIKTKNQTPDDKFVAKLNPNNPKTIFGPDITLKVMAGDTIKITAQAFCLPNQNNNHQLPQYILNNLILAFNGVSLPSLETGVAANTTQAQNLAQNLIYLQKQNNNKNKPQVFLNYLLFDQYNNLVPAACGAIQAYNTTQWQTLQTDDIIIPQNGFIRVFTSNQSNAPVEINNTTLTITKGHLIEEYNYYPFGLVFDNTTTIGIKQTNFLFNAKELQQNEFGTNNGIELTDFINRTYDQQIGRFLQPDLLSQLRSGISPFNYCQNNPINRVDPTGTLDEECVTCPKPQPQANPAGKDNLAGYSPKPPPMLQTQSGGIPRATVSADNRNPEERQRSANNANYLANGGTGVGIIEKTAYAAGKVLDAVNSLPATITLPLMAIAPETILTEGTAAKGSTSLTKFYPANNGFLGATERTFLMPGEQISRYGSGAGKFFSPAGTPLPMRALPPGANTNIFNTYKVLKPFEVQAGKIAPAFGQSGLGTQYLSPVSVDVLLKREIIGH